MYSSMDGMLVHRRVTPSIKFASTHSYNWVEIGTVRVKCLAQEQNTMSPARVQTGPLTTPPVRVESWQLSVLP